MNKQSAINNMLVLTCMLIIGLLTSVLLTHNRLIWILFLLFSLALISIGKYSQFKNGKLIDFGSKSMDKPFNYFYFVGWFFLIIAIIISLTITLHS